MTKDDDILLPSEVAVRLRVNVGWIYRHAEHIGGYHVGKYWRFRWGRVLERLEEGNGWLGIEPNDPKSSQ